jgi:deoxyribose-phosphate aldolase
MDQKQLIDRIVAEVVARMGSGAAGAKPATTAAAPGAGPAIPAADIARFIDHTLLRPEAPTAAIEKLCDEAVKHHFWSVCVNSSRVALVARRLQGTGVKVCSVVGFPLGAMARSAKAFETREAISEGAAEIDMVINVGLLKSGDVRGVEEDIRFVRRATRGTTVLKVIIETALLTQDEKVLACEIAKKAEADFVKTCTGFSGGGATVEDIALMRRVVGKEMGVKASGGIRTYKQAAALLEAGASRIGSAASVAIVSGGEGPGAY